MHLLTTALIIIATSVMGAVDASALIRFAPHGYWPNAHPAVGDADWPSHTANDVSYLVRRGRSVIARALDGIGTPLWSVAHSSVVGGAMTNGAGDLLLICTTTSLEMRNPLTGTLLRQFDLPEGSGIPCNKGHATVANHPTEGEIAVISTTRGRLFAVRLSDAGMVWMTNKGNIHGFNGPVAIHGDTALLASYTGHLFKFSIELGEELMSMTLDGITTFIPNGPIHGVSRGITVHGDRVFFVVNQHLLLVVVDVADFSILSTSGLTSLPFTTPSVEKDADTEWIFIAVAGVEGIAHLFYFYDEPGAFWMTRTTYNAGQRIRTNGRMPIVLHEDRKLVFVQTTYGHLDIVDMSTRSRIARYYNHRLGTLSVTPTVGTKSGLLHVVVQGGLRDQLLLEQPFLH